MQDYIICYKCGLQTVDESNYFFDDSYICEDCYLKKQIVKEEEYVLSNLEAESDIKYQKWKLQNQK